MAEVSISPSAVFPSSAAELMTALASVEITAGDAVYFDETTLKFGKAVSADLSHGAGGQKVGLASNHAYANQPVTVVLKDPALDLGPVLTKGEAYWVAAGSSLGKIIPTADLGGTYYRLALGAAKSSSLLTLAPYTTGATG